MDQKDPKKITLGLVLSWILGIFFALGGFGMLFTNFLSGILVLLTAAILLPPVNKFIKKKLNFILSRGLKIVLIIALLTLAGLSLPSEESSDLDGAIEELNESVDELKETVGDEGEEKEKEEEIKEEISYTKVDLDTMLGEFDNNQVAATEKYENKYIETAGVVSDIKADILDEIFISLEPNSADEWYIGLTLQCYIREGENVSEISKGDTITVQTQMDPSNLDLFSVTARDCIIKK